MWIQSARNKAQEQLGKIGVVDCIRLASAAETPDGHTYVLVTAFADGTYAPVYDAIDIYRNYIPSSDAAEAGATDAGG